MKKFIYQNIIEAYSGIMHPIEEEKFYLIKRHYEFLLKVSWIEDKFSILLENFYEFHESIFQIYGDFNKNSKNHIVAEPIGQKGINILNRRLLNLLSSTKMYLDQLMHDTSEMGKKYDIQSLYGSMKKITHEYYDKSLSYQLLEFIRNIVQHKFLVIRELVFVIPIFAQVEDLNAVPFFVNAFISDLEKDKKFQNKI